MLSVESSFERSLLSSAPSSAANETMELSSCQAVGLSPRANRSVGSPTVIVRVTLNARAVSGDRRREWFV